jgi:ribonuclease-3
VFLRLLESEYPNINLKTLGKDFKTSLQEFTQAKFGVTPRYELVGASGPDHKKTFEMALFIGESLRATASGASKKDAEQKAAQIVLKEYNLLSKDEK